MKIKKTKQEVYCQYNILFAANLYSVCFAGEAYYPPISVDSRNCLKHTITTQRTGDLQKVGHDNHLLSNQEEYNTSFVLCQFGIRKKGGEDRD